MADEFQAGTETPAVESAPEASPAGDKPAKKTTAKKATTKKAAATTAAKKAPAKKATTKKAAAKKTATTEPVDQPVDQPLDLGTDAPAEAPAEKPVKKTAARKTTRKTTAKKAVAVPAEEATEAPQGDPVAPGAPTLLFQAPEPTVTTTTRRRTAKAAAPTPDPGAPAEESATEAAGEAPAEKSAAKKSTAKKTTAKKSTAKKSTAKKSTAKKSTESDAPAAEPESAEASEDELADEQGEQQGGQSDEQSDEQGEGSGGNARRRRRRGGRRRRKSGNGEGSESGEGAAEDKDGDTGSEESTDGDDQGDGEKGEGSSRRRRRRRRTGEDGGEGSDDPENTVTRVRSRRAVEDEITAVSGSTRLEAKKQRRREGREAGRRRAPIVSEAEFLARRESVDRTMVIRQREDLTQIGVLEDRVLVEHYVARESQTSLIGNVYLGRVQNVLPSMEAAFIDIGKGRNAVLYAGEVNWSALGHKDGQPRKIESVLSSGQSVLVQVTKDPIGHKGARLTSQVSLAGRFLVYVPDGTTSGISRKLPDTERGRLKALLKEIVPDSAGVIVRTAAEGASEEELTRDVERLKARWEDIEGKVKGNAPQLLYGEPDLTLKVVRDLFTEDFSKLVIQGDDAWETVRGYVQHVAPDLEERLERYEPGKDGQGGKADVFAEYRLDEQIAKGLDRKVWLPSGGSLIIDRTEAMTVVDVNTGKFTGSGGNLEETVTKNNLEAAEEIVRQLRLRDIGGIIVVDFIDMVLESNRDLVLRRLVECLGRDRTRHQVAEVTSLGLVQMTRKRIGTGLLEAFSENCEHCQGRGLVVHDHPVESKRGGGDEEPRRSSRRGGRRGRGGNDAPSDTAQEQPKPPSPKDVAAMAKPEATPATAPEPAPEPEAVAPAPAEDAPAAELEKPQVSTRSRRRSGDRPAGRSESAEAVPEPTPEPVVEATPEPAPEPEAPVEEAQAPAAEPEKPKVSTRSRRRSASRPAGQPEPVQPAVEAVVEPTVEPTEEPVVEPTAEPAAEQREPQAAPEPPKVVTRTRGRSASRPAGPPVDELPPPVGVVGSVGAPPQDGIVEPGTADAEPGSDDAAHVEHVPIKKKGSRKR